MESRTFTPIEGFALGKSKYDPNIHKGYYMSDYMEAERRIADPHHLWTREAAYRALILSDLWFLLYFIIGTPDSVGGHHEFIVMKCNEVQIGPKTNTLDVWARGHLKSSIITIAESIQYILANPEHCCCILSYKASVAKDKFLTSIKNILEDNLWLKACFPDVLWESPQKEAPRWSLDGGLYVKRFTKRGEASFYAGGLIEGMPTGHHYERRIYDDVVTEDIGGSPNVMEDVKKKYDSSQNLGMLVGTNYHRVIGTFYHYHDPLVYIRDKKDPVTGKKMYNLRLYPATEDGRPDGKSVFMDQETLDKMKGDKTFRPQQLCDPVPMDYVTLDADMLDYPEQAPSGCYTFVIVDQAGDDDANVVEGDDWAILTVKVRPVLSEIGASDVYIADIFAEPVSATEGIDLICQKYIGAGMPMVLGIEKASHSATHAHVKDTIKRIYGRHLEVVNDLKKHRAGVILLLRPQKRNKKRFIDLAVEWPLKNKKLHILPSVQPRYIDKLITEMKTHPYGEDNILNCLAYLFADVIPQYNFPAFLHDNMPEIPDEGAYV